MTNEGRLAPRYKHECDLCVFIGQRNEWDIWLCIDGHCSSLIFRRGDYSSGLHPGEEPPFESVVLWNPDDVERILSLADARKAQEPEGVGVHRVPVMDEEGRLAKVGREVLRDIDEYQESILVDVGELADRMHDIIRKLADMRQAVLISLMKG